MTQLSKGVCASFLHANTHPLKTRSKKVSAIKTNLPSILTWIVLATACSALLVLSASLAMAATVITSDTTLQANLLDNVVIGADDVTLDCAGHSIIGFPPSTGIAVSARSGVTIKNCTVSGFLDGIDINNASSVTLINIVLQNNVVNGLRAFDNSHVAILGSFATRDNTGGVFAINNVSITIIDAVVTIERNEVGFNLGVNSSVLVFGLPPSPPTTIIVQNNSSDGLQAVSNSEYFMFGSVDVQASRNGGKGITLFSRSLFELDNGASVTAEDNIGGAISMEGSTFNMFNMAQFAGAAVTARGTGIDVGKASVFDMGDDATMLIENTPTGFSVDDGSTVRIRNSTITNNTQEDVTLTFGSRATFDEGNTIGGVSCDETVLVRGEEECDDDDDDDDD